MISFCPAVCVYVCVMYTETTAQKKERLCTYLSHMQE